MYFKFIQQIVLFLFMEVTIQFFLGQISHVI
jgi:hypothetical protein